MDVEQIFNLKNQVRLTKNEKEILTHLLKEIGDLFLGKPGNKKYESGLQAKRKRKTIPRKTIQRTGITATTTKNGNLRDGR